MTTHLFVGFDKAAAAQDARKRGDRKRQTSGTSSWSKSVGERALTAGALGGAAGYMVGSGFGGAAENVYEKTLIAPVRSQATQAELKHILSMGSIKAQFGDKAEQIMKELDALHTRVQSGDSMAKSVFDSKMSELKGLQKEIDALKVKKGIPQIEQSLKALGDKLKGRMSLKPYAKLAPPVLLGAAGAYGAYKLTHGLNNWYQGVLDMNEKRRK